MTRSAGTKSIWCVLATVATIAPACATRPNILAIAAHEAEVRPEIRRERLHAALRAYPEPHDAYIHLMLLADETTVPLLLERFRIDYPMAPPPEPPPDPVWIDPFPYSIGRVGPAVTTRTLQAFVCVQGHLVDALTYATNTNRGMYHPAWQAWWTENQHKSRREWIAQGFKDAGLSPSDPIDEPYGLDLIGVLPDSRAHLAVNARRLLQTVPMTDRVEWIQKAARSEQRHRRLGAVSALRHLEPAGHEELLRSLTADPDAEVRLTALDTLNERLRRRPDRRARASRVRGPGKAREFGPVAVTDDLLVVAGRRGIEAFDTRAGRRRWRSRSIGAHALLILNDRVVAGQYDGGLKGFDSRGNLAWQAPSRGEPDHIRRLLAIDRDLGVLRNDRLEWRDPETGRILHDIAARTIRDADAAGRTVYVLTDDRLQKMIDGRVLARRDVRGGRGVSVRDSTVCVIRHEGESQAAPAEVACYDADTLALRWAQPVPRTNTWGHGVAPVQSASTVYVPSHTQLTAFRRDDGALLWADRAGQELHGSLLVASWGLFSIAPDYRLERRAFDSGEVISVWPGKKGATAVAPSGRVAAFAAADGSVWIIRPPDPGQTHRNRVPSAFEPAAKTTPFASLDMARSTTMGAGVAPRLSTSAPARRPTTIGTSAPTCTLNLARERRAHQVPQDGDWRNRLALLMHAPNEAHRESGVRSRPGAGRAAWHQCRPPQGRSRGHRPHCRTG